MDKRLATMIFSAVCFLLGGSIGRGQTSFTATYSFGSSGGVTSFSYNGTSYDGISPGTMDKVGITSSSSTGNFRGSNWPTGATSGSDTFTGSVDLGYYIGFTIDAVSGYKFTIASVTFGVGRSGTGPRQWQWRGSDDSYGSILSSYTTVNAGLTNTSGVLTTTDVSSGWTGNVLDVSSTYVDQTGTVGFRLYGYNSEGSPGTGGLQGDITIEGTYESLGGIPTKLVVTSVNGGNSPSANTGFDVVVQSKDNSDITQNVTSNTGVSLSLETGNGTLGGTLTGTINAGENSVTFSGITYDVAESNVSVTATRTSGDILDPGTSSTFTVLEAASKLAFSGVPSAGQQNTNLSSFTVEAQRSDNSVDQNYTGTITVAKQSGPGNISGTLSPSAVSGAATFSDVQFDAGGTYTISASASGLTGTTSGSISILSTNLPLIENFDYTTSTTLTSNGWYANSAAGTNSITVVDSNLTYAGYPSSGIGKSILLTTSGEDANRRFDTVTTGDVYVSFLVRVSTAQTAGDYFFAFSANNSSAYIGRIFAKDVSGSLYFGLGKVTTPPTYTIGTYAYSSTHLIIMKYTFNTGSGTDDAVGIYVDPTVTGPEPASFDAQGTTSDADASPGIAFIQLRQGSSSNAPTLQLSGIRVATSWDEAGLPVEMISFSAKANRLSAQLKWSTSTEVDNSGFEIERKTLASGWTKVGFVPGTGTSTSLQTYEYSDNVPAAGVYSYRLKQVDRTGLFKYSQETQVDVGSAPRVFSLSQNYPNPFNPSTTLEFTIPEDGRVVLKVYDVVGRAVATLLNEDRKAGEYQKVDFDASRYSSGIYFAVLRSAGRVLLKKMLLLK